MGRRGVPNHPPTGWLRTTLTVRELRNALDMHCLANPGIEDLPVALEEAWGLLHSINVVDLVDYSYTLGRRLVVLRGYKPRTSCMACGRRVRSKDYCKVCDGVSTDIVPLFEEKWPCSVIAFYARAEVPTSRFLYLCRQLYDPRVEHLTDVSRLDVSYEYWLVGTKYIKRVDKSHRKARRVTVLWLPSKKGEEFDHFCRYRVTGGTEDGTTKTLCEDGPDD